MDKVTVSVSMTMPQDRLEEFMLMIRGFERSAPDDIEMKIGADTNTGCAEVKAIMEKCGFPFIIEYDGK